jgi:hypothetical protein
VDKLKDAYNTSKGGNKWDELFKQAEKKKGK